MTYGISQIIVAVMELTALRSLWRLINTYTNLGRWNIMFSLLSRSLTSLTCQYRLHCCLRNSPAPMGSHTMPYR
ncbi:hypothetical protein CRG98_024783 [Punica granatum]|uniref:Uncharacterized protein n=1 Tax=Punica granatum TaxID=22663 RepID=A0A2I0JEZ9_PUNGR|nr:hypothetical protein CRG98_024783 [Punica granatum]